MGPSLMCVVVPLLDLVGSILFQRMVLLLSFTEYVRSFPERRCNCYQLRANPPAHNFAGRRS